MKFSKSYLLASVVGTALLSTSAFAAGVHPETGEKLADDQTFTYRVLDEHSSVDPAIVEDVSGSELVRNLFEGLYNQDNLGNLVPGVALSHAVSDDNLTYTFKLRNDAKWSDGKPVTAGDFVYGWQRAADPANASPYAWYMELMSLENAKEVIAGDMEASALGVKALDDHTLEVKLTQPLPYFALMTTHATTFPSPKWAIEAHGTEWTKPGNIVSNGAYQMVKHVPQETVSMERNTNYWDNESTIIDKVEALVINDENVALTRYLAGETDRTETPAGQFPRLLKEYPDQAVVFPRLCSYYYTFNQSASGPEKFQDARVRKALAYAIDRRVITDAVIQGGQFPAYTFTPAVTAGFEVPKVDYAGWSQPERDAKAKELLEAAGYTKDNPLEFDMVYNTSEAHKKVAIAMTQMWKQKLGVEVTLNNMEWKTFLNERRNGNFELARGAWCGDYNEASTFLDLMDTNSGYNDGKFTNAEVDKLLADAKSSAQPQGNYTRIEEIMAAEMPVIPIYHYTNTYMMNAQLKNWPIKNAEQNWYAKNLYKVAK
ncbi:Periplasmic murein peptide-binding protein precursor [Pseudovibrio axinellae]|uniref:Periplasmic murein peptide-binding protein n=1 Tax=Pseudovibrio axinellae TaxID=989403 RepID=A0A165ZH08_9HYPH|nr:peptide ABC transporter substrate-binding protein [Pseudovibrio axinellae]KZL19889.1 Periplasmic murein peptide-binding protein precursor [Pseudovibrio axinellae]SER38098.1 oligopeptide transport system substrate-binding protein [Pseudovibrio axinellae]